MATDEIEIAMEIVCTSLPGEAWTGDGLLYLGIQRDDQPTELTSVVTKRVVFRPILRARSNTDGSTNFLGPFAHGPRSERFVYLVWVVVQGKAPAKMVGRIKVHLNHIRWTSVEKATVGKKPIRVTLVLTDAKGKPVMASVRPDVANWELP